MLEVGKNNWTISERESQSTLASLPSIVSGVDLYTAASSLETGLKDKQTTCAGFRYTCRSTAIAPAAPGNPP